MKKIGIILLILVALGCSKDDGGGPPVPSAASLIFPDNNQECNQGIIVGSTQSTVTFRWSVSANSDSYNVVVKNLNNQITATHSTLVNELAITIQRGAPYSWYVVSKSADVVETAQSATWKFYNAGDPISSYTPFPADLVSPTLGATITGVSSQNLVWQGSDIDNDIVSYDVYFGTTNPPTTLNTNTASTSVNVSVAADNIYYWRVVTKDSQGNTSQSEIFQFKVE